VEAPIEAAPVVEVEAAPALVAAEVEATPAPVVGEKVAEKEVATAFGAWKKPVDKGRQ
jgi:hypothetical protein